MIESERRQDLHRKIDLLDQPSVAVVEQFVDAILAPVESETTEGSWLTTRSWTAAFVARLRAHHALNPEPLSTTTFEAAFDGACRAAGWRARQATSATNRFFDTVVSIPGRDEISLSLKASAAANMSPHKVHISKLTEAAWIQDARTQTGRHDKLVDLFREYREQTSSIVMLRCFRRSDSMLYELLEIPTSLFASVDELSVADAQAATIPIPPLAAVPDARIVVDRSDAKITISGIRLEVCVVHGRWSIPNLSGIVPR